MYSELLRMAAREHAERMLPISPLRHYGVDRLIVEAKGQAARFLPTGALDWLPDARACFSILAE